MASGLVKYSAFSACRIRSHAIMHWHIIFGHHRANNAAFIPHTRNAGVGTLRRDATLALPSMAGVAVGSGLTAIAPADILKATFVVIACGIASKFLIGGERWVVGTELPDPAALAAAASSLDRPRQLVLRPIIPPACGQPPAVYVVRH